MKAFVTGATGFLGRYLVEKLVKRGYEVYGLTRTEEGAASLRAMGTTPVLGDINDAELMRPAMAGSDIVFHLASYVKVGAADWMQAENVNVAGTRTVLSLAHELRVPKIIYTSTAVAYGNTKGQMVDESYRHEGPFLSEYERTKWLAHYQVAEPMIQAGAPIIIVVPGGAYGPGDRGWVMQYMRQFYEGKMPVLISPNLVYTYAHVEDIAEGHILAAEKGKIGESYILAGPAIPLGEMIDFWALITGRSAPIVRLPAQMVKAAAPVMGAARNALPLPDILDEETLNQSDVTYMVRADRARAELGWRTRSLQEGMTATFRWINDTMPEAPTTPTDQKERQLAGLALLAAAVLLLLWMLGRRKKA